MAITTYAELVTALGVRIVRSDLATRYGEFIALAEAEANRVLDCRQMYVRNDSFTVMTVNPALPATFAGVRSFHLNTNPVTRLQYVKADEFDDVREAASEGVGRPLYYTIVGDAFLMAPTPDTTYTATLVYRRTLPALTESNTTNWLLTAHPDVYLNGALAYAFGDMEDDQMELKHRTLFERGLLAINGQDQRQSYGSSPARRMRPFA
jgi:hypothetical protein